jgi:hypothetical protein
MAGEKIMSGNLRLTLGDGTVFHSTECSFQLSRELKERITKDTDGVQVSKGKKRWTASISGLATYGGDGVGTKDFFALFDLYDDDTDTTIAIEFVPDETDAGFKLAGTAVISDLELTAPVEEDATISCSLSGSNKMNKVAIV